MTSNNMKKKVSVTKLRNKRVKITQKCIEQLSSLTDGTFADSSLSYFQTKNEDEGRQTKEKQNKKGGPPPTL